MAAQQARAFAALGYAVLQIDLFGCGDSCGAFAAGRWAQWQQDLAEAQAQLDAILGSTSNAADNLKLMGSLVGTGVQAAGMIGARMGGPSNNIPGGGSTGNASDFGKNDGFGGRGIDSMGKA